MIYIDLQSGDGVPQIPSPHRNAPPIVRMAPVGCFNFGLNCHEIGVTMRLGAIIAALVTGIALPAAAHPHMFTDAGIEVIFNEDGHASALRIT